MKTTLLLLFSLLLLGGNLMSANFYWVGGSGQWNDVSHWATSSGGGELHFATPSANDDVYFDESSFTAPGQTVDFQQLTIQCRSLYVSSEVEGIAFLGEYQSKLDVHGDLLITGALEWRARGTLTLLASIGAATVNTGGRDIDSRVIFAGGATGSWLVTSDLKVNGQLTVVDGSLAFSPGLTVYATRINFDEATVDYTDLTLEAFYEIELSATAAELPSLATCTVRFTSPTNSGELALGGSKNIRFASIRSVGGLSIDDRAFVDVRTTTAGADSILVGTNSFYEIDVEAGHLALNAGTTHNLRANVDLHVESMRAVGSCTETIALIGLNGATLGADAGARLVFENLYVEEIEAVGAGDFTALRSSGTGNVAGWNFVGADGPDRYWVGGTGNWLDPGHWAFTSGGTPGACPPSAINNVIFDAASFTAAGDTLYLPEKNLRCNTFDWRLADEATTLMHPRDATLSVYGSFYLYDQLDWAVENNRPTIVFRGNAPGREILTRGRTELLDFLFDGGGGAWNLLDDLTVNYEIQGRAGRLNTNGHDLSCGQLRFESGSAYLDLADSYVYIRDFGVGSITRMRLTSGGFNSVNATVISSNVDGSFELDLRNTDSGQNHLLSVTSAGYLEVDAQDFYCRKVEIGKSAHLHTNGRIDSLLLAPGGEYTFRGQGTTELALDYLLAEGDCFNRVTLNSAADYTLSAAAPQRGAFLQLENITASGATWVAESSLDFGGTAGWTFTHQPTTRTLYWVGGGGHWFDPAHWSATPGGPGGECLPTRIDDVVINAASFPVPGATLDFNFNPGVNERDDPTPVCRSFDARGLANDVGFDGYSLDVHGSCYLAPPIDFKIIQLDLKGEASAELLTAEAVFDRLLFTGPGDYTLTDSLYAPNCEIQVRNGTFRTGGHNVFAREVKLIDAPPESGITTTFDIEDSRVVLTYSLWPVWMISARNSVIASSGGKMIFTADTPHAYFNTSIDGLDIEFLKGEGNNTGISISSVYNGQPRARFGTVIMREDGLLAGPMSLDTLLLTKGFSYRVNNDGTPTEIVGELRAVGTACNPISIEPLSLGEAGTITFRPDAQAAMDYVRIDRVNADGAGTYLAGRNSVKVNNASTGWIYETNPMVASLNRYFLGDDLDVCSATVPRLIPDLPPNFDATYAWRDGTTTAEFQPPGSGVYRLNITFDEGQCSLADSIRVTAPAFALNTPTSHNVCGTDTLRIEVPDPAASGYSWVAAEGAVLEDNTTWVLVRVPGRYFLRQSLLACTDSTEITVVAGASIRSGEDVITCRNSEYATPLGTYTIRQDTVIEERYLATSGCDSLHTLTFTLRPAVTGAETVEICAGGTHVTPLGSYVINADTSFTEQYQGRDGCDSLRTLNFSLLPVVRARTTVELCEVGKFSTSLRDYTVAGDTTIVETYTAFNGCDSVQTWRIRLPPPPTVLETATVTDVSCFGAADGAVRVPGGNFLFYLDGVPVVADSPVSDLAARSYELSAETPRGCVLTRTVTVAAPAEMSTTLPATVLITDPSGLNLRAEVAGGTEPYEYRWQAGDGSILRFSCDDCPNPQLIAHQPTTLDLLITDAAGCALAATTEVRVFIPQNSYLPQAFSPNDDGINDFLTIYGTADAFVVERMEVYDRWGSLVYRAENFAPGSADGGWDGADRETGVYAVVLKLRWPDGNSETVRSVVQLLR